MENKVTSVKEKLIPIILTLVVIILDQVSKALVVKFIQPYTVGASFFNGFFRIIHVRNTGVAFSVGATWGQTLRNVMFSLVPLVVIALVFVIYFRNNEFTKVQRWAIAGIMGGGIGNIIDRIFRREGVVDFLDVKWFDLENARLSLFRMPRWPTFNIADSAVVVCGILLIVSFIVVSVKGKKSRKDENPAQAFEQ